MNDPGPVGPIIQLPSVDRDDINQEAALLELQGKVPNRRILGARLRPKELTFDRAPESGIPIDQLNPSPVPPAECLELLIDWTLDQTLPVQAQLWRFLEDPEELLDETLAFLVALDLAVTHVQDHPKELSLSQIMRDALPATKADLADLVARLSPNTRRPEATVRQWLRRGLREESLILLTDGTVITGASPNGDR